MLKINLALLLLKLIILLNHLIALVNQLLLLVHELRKDIIKLLFHIVNSVFVPMIEIELFLFSQVILNSLYFLFKLYLCVIIFILANTVVLFSFISILLFVLCVDELVAFMLILRPLHQLGVRILVIGIVLLFTIILFTFR